MHTKAAINRTHRASTGTTGDADIPGAAPDQEAASPITALLIRRRDALPSELHVMVLMLLPGWLEEDGSACLYTSAAPETTRRRRAAAE